MNSVRISTAILSLSLLLCGGLGCSPGANSGKPGEGGKMRMASLQNKAGKFIEPSIESGQKALAAAALPDDLIGWASDPEGEGSYPIVTYTWIIAYKKYADPKRGNALKNVLSWCLTDGQKESPALGYIPLPTAVADKVKAALATIAVEGGDKNEAKGPVSLQGAGASFPRLCIASGLLPTMRPTPRCRSTISRWAAGQVSKWSSTTQSTSAPATRR